MLFVTTIALIAMALNVETYVYMPVNSESLMRYPIVYIFDEGGEKLKRQSSCASCYPDSGAENFDDETYNAKWGMNNCSGCYDDSMPFYSKRSENNDGKGLQCKDLRGNVLLCEELERLLKKKTLLRSILYKNMPRMLNIFRIP